MDNLKHLEVWFLTGTQNLYGDKVLEKVTSNSQKISQYLDEAPTIAVQIVFKPILKSSEEIYQIISQANTNSNCIGIITWMHTFSPAKMWIKGLHILQKPMLHLHTQFNRDIPWDNIDMDFMNLNQSAHGDREFGFLVTRMRIERKVVVGFWQDEKVVEEINIWGRAAAGWNDWQGAKFARIGDNMRYVAVTEGDKVEAELKFGFSVNTYGVGDVVAIINSIPQSEVDDLVLEYKKSYTIDDDLLNDDQKKTSIIEAARIELGLKKFLIDGNFKGFTDTFEDLHGMIQLPGIAAQRLMQQGYGFAGEGDWKTAALLRACKVMATGLKGGTAFMEDYTYHLDPQNTMVLGAHMLEIDASLAKDKPRLEVHPLGIGGKADPARLVFNVAGGNALNVSLIDMGNRFRLIVNEVEAVEVKHPLPKLPVARVLWKPLPNFNTACTAWIYAGGAHHTVYSQCLTTPYFRDFAKMAKIELVIINADTEINQFEKELKWNDISYK